MSRQKMTDAQSEEQRPSNEFIKQLAEAQNPELKGKDIALHEVNANDYNELYKKYDELYKRAKEMEARYKRLTELYNALIEQYLNVK